MWKLQYASHRLFSTLVFRFLSYSRNAMAPTQSLSLMYSCRVGIFCCTYISKHGLLLASAYPMLPMTWSLLLCWLLIPGGSFLSDLKILFQKHLSQSLDLDIGYYEQRKLKSLSLAEKELVGTAGGSLGEVGVPFHRLFEGLLSKGDSGCLWGFKLFREEVHICISLVCTSAGYLFERVTRRLVRIVTLDENILFSFGAHLQGFFHSIATLVAQLALRLRFTFRIEQFILCKHFKTFWGSMGMRLRSSAVLSSGVLTWFGHAWGVLVGDAWNAPLFALRTKLHSHFPGVVVVAVLLQAILELELQCWVAGSLLLCFPFLKRLVANKFLRLRWLLVCSNGIAGTPFKLFLLFFGNVDDFWLLDKGVFDHWRFLRDYQQVLFVVFVIACDQMIDVYRVLLDKRTDDLNSLEVEYLRCLGLFIESVFVKQSIISSVPLGLLQLYKPQLGW